MKHSRFFIVPFCIKSQELVSNVFSMSTFFEHSINCRQKHHGCPEFFSRFVNANGKYVCPIDHYICEDMTSIVNHFRAVHRCRYESMRARMCQIVFPGSVPSSEQLVAWRKRFVPDCPITKMDCEMLAGIRITPCGELDAEALFVRFWGCTNSTARDHIRNLMYPVPKCNMAYLFNSERPVSEWVSKITYFSFEEGKPPTAVVYENIFIEMMKRIPRPADNDESRAVYTLRAVSGELHNYTNVDNLAMWMELVQKADLPCCDEAKQEQKETVREDWLHAAPGENAESLAAVFKGFSVLDVLAQAKLLCLIYKGVNRAGFADALCVEIDAMRAREALALADATRVAIAQELTKQATEKTKQEACGVHVFHEGQKKRRLE